MDEQKKIPDTAKAPVAGAPAKPVAQKGRGNGDRRGGSASRRGGSRNDRRDEPREFEQKTLHLARVTRVTAGGKRMSFRAAIVIGDKKGRVGFGVAKGADVQIAMDKAFRQAKKHVIRVVTHEDTIPHPVYHKFGSAVLLLKPAPRGTGLKCGGAVRVVLELAGVPNAVSKIINSTNKINIAKATFGALELLRKPKVVVQPSASVPPATASK